MIPLQKMFDWGGEEISAFLEEDLRDLLVITLSKYVWGLDANFEPNTHYSCSPSAVEATLAILLLHKCE